MCSGLSYLVYYSGIEKVVASIAAFFKTFSKSTSHNVVIHIKYWKQREEYA